MIKLLRRFNLNSTKDLQKSLVSKAKSIQIKISSNPLKTIEYYKLYEINPKTFNKAVDTLVRIYIIRPTAKEAKQ